MLSRHFSLLSLPAALVLCAACKQEHSSRYADVTEWVVGLPADNICTLAAPLAEVAAGSRNALPQQAGRAHFPDTLTPHDTLLRVHDADAAADGEPPLPVGSRAELLSVWVEQLEMPGAPRAAYAVFAELQVEGYPGSVWVYTGTLSRAGSLPLLLRPADGQPLSLDLEDALEYCELKKTRH